VLVVHYAGSAVNVAPLLGHGFAVIEDAAHAVGPTTDGGIWLPVRGDAAVYSFFANKNLPVGEGGMVATNREDIAADIRRLRGHGMTTGTWDRHRGHAYDYDVLAIGTNARLTEVQAALGAAGLADLPAHNETRRRLLSQYEDALTGSKVGLALAGSDSTAHLAVAVLPEAGGRARVRERLATAGVQTSFHYPPIHRFAAYRDLEHAPLPVTEAASERLVTLPLHPYLSEGAVELIVSTLLEAL